MVRINSIQELTEYLLNKNCSADFGKGFWGGSSHLAQAYKNLSLSLNKLQTERGAAKKKELLDTLEGQVMMLQVMTYYSESETKYIVDAIETIKEGEN
jgi:hypothetical protein